MKVTKKYFAIFVSLFMISSSFGFLFAISAATGSGGDDVSPYAGSSPRTVCVETFTADWCVYCPGAAHVWERFMDELGHDNFFLIEHHSSSSDEFYDASSGSPARMSKYGVGGYPVGLIDGGGPYTTEQLWTSGSTGKYTTYMTYRPIIETELARTSPCLIDIETEMWATGGNAHVTIDFTDIPSEDNLQLQVIVQEGSLFHRDGNTNEVNAHHRVYNNVVRDMLTPIDLPWPILPGSNYEYDVPFTVDSGWYPSMDLRRIGISALVQTTNLYNIAGGGQNYPILQAAYHECVEPEVLVVNADETDNIDNGIDHFDEELTKVNINKHVMWDTFEGTDSNTDNVRVNPTFADMAPYKAVIWYEGVDTNTLDAVDRSNLAQYLDNGGSVFLTGSNIAEGSAGGWESWLQTNFHSQLTSVNTGDVTIDGLAGDPIGDGMTGLVIEGTSPDGIGTYGAGAFVSFEYSGAQDHAIRATHTGGGRTVYFAGNYFLNTDTIDANADDETIMLRILGDWLDGAQPPEVTVNYPNGGELFAQSEALDITWNAEDVRLIDLPVSIYYCTDYPIATWNLIASGEANDGIYHWTTPAVDSDECRIRVVAEDSQAQNGEDVSDTDFTIGDPNEPPLADLTTPDGGELYPGGVMHRIWWNMSDSDDPIEDLVVNLYYSTDSGGSYPNVIATGLTGFTAGTDPRYLWDPLPSIDSTTVRVRVEVVDTKSLSTIDDSQNDFEIDSTAPAPATNTRAELDGTGVRIYWDASPSPDVDHYVVYWGMNVWDSSGDTYVSQLNAGLNTDVLHANVGVNNPQTYVYQVRTYDTVGHETKTTVQAAKYGSTQSILANPSGWYLLGNSLVQSDTSLAHVIQGYQLPAEWDCVRTFDADAGNWHINVPTAPGSINTLTDINTDQGFWLHVTDNTRYAGAGYVEDKAITLYDGWNLVAYPFAARTMTSGAVMTHLTANCPNYDGMLIADTSQPYHLNTPAGTENLFHNYAFLVHVSGDTTWTVTNY